VIHARIVYCVTRDLDAASVLADMECLSAEERTRAAQFAFDEDRRDFVVAHALLRRMLTAFVPRDPAAWSFITSPSGKPGLANPDLEGGSIAFNLSHTRGLVACVVARGADVGIDVERVPAGDDVLDVARAHFSRAEVRDLERRAAAEQRERFTELWTLKEAHAKSTGAGIVSGDDLLSFAFSASGLIEASAAAEERAWTFALFRVLDYRVAVAVRADGPTTISISPSENDAVHGEARLLRVSRGAVIASEITPAALIRVLERPRPS
jgi:phosphopantetheinyl transferase